MPAPRMPSRSQLRLGLLVGAICVTFFLIFDFLYSSYLSRRVHVATAKQKEINRASRVGHPILHHALKPNVDGKMQWGTHLYAFRTNDLGFVDKAPRTVQKKAARERIVFVGNSFTEGLGVPWDDTFVGISIS